MCLIAKMCPVLYLCRTMQNVFYQNLFKKKEAFLPCYIYSDKVDK